MRIVVAGGTGFLGRTLLERLHRHPHVLRLLTRRTLDRAEFPSGIELVQHDVLTPVPASLLKGAEVVINLTGEPVAQRWTRSYKDRILQSRVLSTRNLVRAAVEAGSVRHFLNASAIGYYGDRGEESLTEDSPPGDSFLAGVCKAWEAELAPARAAGIRALAMRFGLVLHPSGGALKNMMLQFRVGAGGPVGSGKQYVSWIHREDALALIELSLSQTSWATALNVTSPHPVTNRAFAQALGQALHRPAALPMPALLLRATLGEMANAMLESQRVVPARALEAGFRFAHPELSEALRSLLAAPSGSPPPGAAAPPS